MSPTTTVTSGLAQHLASPITRKEEGGKQTLPSCDCRFRTSASAHKNRRSMEEDNTRSAGIGSTTKRVITGRTRIRGSQVTAQGTPNVH